MGKLDEKGSTAVLFCIMAAVLFGFAAYAIDIGNVYIEKTKLTNAVDSAVLAAALELPGNTEGARDTAIKYLQNNNIDPNSAVIGISSDNKSIEIYANKNVKHVFAPLIGINSSNVDANAKALIGSIKSVTGGIRPFAVAWYDFVYGQLVTLKTGAGGSYLGNYGAVALGGCGAVVFRENAIYGYSGTISVGDYIDTEPGNMAGATNAIKNYINSEQGSFQNYSRNSIRLWTIPIIESLDGEGRMSVKVIGFAQFYVEAVSDVEGKTEINGRFVKYVTKGEIDTTLTDTGLYAVKLVR